MLLFKIIGLSLLFLCCCAVGFLKAAALSKRTQRLSDFIKGITELAERIRSESTEIKRLFEICFEKSLITGKNEPNEEYLLKEDIALLKEFFGSIGMRDSVSEYERCCLYKGLLENRRCDAEKRSRELSRLYNTLGVLGGIFVVLFFL